MREYAERQVSTFTLAMPSASSMVAGLVRTTGPFVHSGSRRLPKSCEQGNAALPPLRPESLAHESPHPSRRPSKIPARSKGSSDVQEGQAVQSGLIGDSIVRASG
jgi:hypothetical protein